MIRRSLLAAALLSVALVGACRTTGSTFVAPSFAAPQEQLSQVQRSAESSQNADELGRAALATYILTGSPQRAETWVSRALAKNPSEPAALYTRSLIAREALDEVGATKDALAILTGAPKSVFAELAAMRLIEMSQVSPTTDKLILDALGGLEKSSMGLSGRAAARAREVLIAVRDGRNDDAGVVAARAAVAAVPAWTVVGPLQALRLRDFPKPSPFDDPKHVIAASYESPIGAVVPRILPTPTGVLDLDTEPWRGDVFEAVTDVSSSKGGLYLVSLRGLSQATLFVDGLEIARRTAVPQRAPERTWSAVELPPGNHRIRVRLARVESGWLAVSLARHDGEPSDLKFTAPGVGVAPPVATAKRVEGTLRNGSASSDAPAVDYFLRVLRELPDDGEQARADMETLVEAAGETATVRSLRIDLTTRDPDVPRATIMSRVMRDLDGILHDQPNDARAVAGRYQQEAGDKRYDDAAAHLEQLATILGPQHARVLMLRARLSMGRGDAASARKFADAALAADPGRCEALDFRADLARRDGEVHTVDTLLPQLLSCPGGLTANAGYFRSRLKLDSARALLQRLVDRSPTSPAARRSLSDALFALGDVKGAEATLEPLVTMWPRRNDALKRLSVLHELTGEHDAATALLKRAFSLDQSDLTLARGLSADSKADVMPWAARDGLATIAAYKRAHFESNAPAVQVLDAEATEIEPDGSSTSRTHSIVQVLDKRGIDKYGEVSVPADAQPLFIRTIKADGTILDAETIAGKDSISLPNLEPGDFVEYAFLRSNGPRSLAVPGWQGGQFIFQGDDVPFFETTYQVRVPASLGLELDSEALPEPPKVERDGDTLTLTYSRKGVPAYLREPMAPGDSEVLPWLEAGTGAKQDDLIQSLSDWLPLKARVTGETRAFVRGTEQLAPAERVRAIVSKMRNEIRGDSNAFDFSETGAAAIAQGRGNRMLALKAALSAAGIPSHVVLVKPFAANPHTYRFPHADQYNAALLRIEPPGQPVMWMDFGLRQAPFNRIPPALSEGDAYAIPEPGESVDHFTMPKVDPTQDRTDATMELTLGPDGTLTGIIKQSAYGFDAAALRRRLEQANRSQMMKQQERILGATFRGVVLTDLQISDSGDPERPVTAMSSIKVPHFGQRADGTVALPATFGAAQMGPRFISRAERSTPMLLGMDDLSRAHVTITLPSTAKPQVPAPVSLQTPFGHFQALWSLSNGTLTYDEELLVKRGRITPGQYGDFKTFAATIDAAQQREIPLAAL